ncbi:MULTISPECIES: ribonuclease HI family protein [Clostridium]|jgi:ribonuclease HI|uniref:ribonuclease HI family protein n=1 Tax=Clostridium TaxID=1485 RepID=UPI00242E296B|nr:ribonuclease HI family protein [Clostridium tyrobutyricum]
MDRNNIKKEKEKKKYKYIINTDGACSGNPGPMGIGGVIYDNNNVQLTTFSQNIGFGTNNEAEYSAIIMALELIKNYTPGDILIRSDSEVVVSQLNGDYSVRQDHLRRLYNKVKAKIKKLNCLVTFTWVKRSSNTAADKLASTALKIPQADVEQQVNNAEEYDDVVETVPSWQADNNFIPDESLLADLPAVNEECGKEINQLIQLKDKTKFKDYAKLKTHGIDNYSRKKTEELYKIIEVRFGPNTVQWLKNILGEEGNNYSKSILKWVARGLTPDLALKKASVDAEVTANAIKAKHNSIYNY